MLFFSPGVFGECAEEADRAGEGAEQFEPSAGMFLTVDDEFRFEIERRRGRHTTESS